MDEQIIHEWEEDRDGVPYSCKAFSDGHIERQVKEGFESAITNTERAQLELQANIEYMTELMEMEVM